MNLKNTIQLFSNMGPSYIAYRLRHELEKRLGVLKQRHPAHPQKRSFVSLEEWRRDNPAFLFQSHEDINLSKTPSRELQKNAFRILNGEIPFFSSDWKNLGKDYDWVTNPDSGFPYDRHMHWSQINDYSAERGDIKYVWEKSRFTYLHTILRYDYHFEEDHSEWVFNEISSWIDHNPTNCGPNYRCSQEMSLRLMNWCFALYFYRDSPAITEDLWKRMQNTIYWHLHHIYHHINFSRIAVRNNHAITETLMLSLSHSIFPFIPETQKWSEKGRAWFEQEVLYQIYEDGTYLQFSMNYQRAVIQLLSFGFALAQKNSWSFSPEIYERAYKAMNFLYQCQQDQNGHLPNYGANDGALFFQFSDALYRDYRPQLNTLHHILTGKPLYQEGAEYREEASWFGIGEKDMGFNPLLKQQGIVEFPIGGYYLIREEEKLTFLRCGNHKDRPAQADNLHLDIWCGKENLLRDSGSYKYNTSNELLRYFMGTAGHNTVMLGDYDQMQKGSRFIWFNWTQAEEVSCLENEDHYLITGRIKAFTHIAKDIRHERQVKKYKGHNEWEICDRIFNKPPELEMKQIWHLGDKTAPDAFEVRTRGVSVQQLTDKYSSEYGSYVLGQSLIMRGPVHQICTRIKT